MFADVYLVDDDLQLVDDDAIVEIESKLDVPLPSGYHRFLTTLGHGTLCDQLYVFLPDTIEEHTAELRATLHTHFFWDRGLHVLPLSQIEESLLIARSLNGDELIYHPNSKHGVYVLPRHDDTIYWLSCDFTEPMQWHSNSGVVSSTPMLKYFEPAIERSSIELFTGQTDHNIADVAAVITTALAGGMDTRSIIEDHYQLHFHKHVGSRVQLAQADNDGRIAIRIDYSPKHEQLVSGCVLNLKSDGFYETDKYTS